MSRSFVLAFLTVLILVVVAVARYAPPAFASETTCVQIATPEWWASHPDAVPCPASTPAPSASPTAEQEIALPDTAMR